MIGWILDDSRQSPVEYATVNPNFVNANDRAQACTRSGVGAWLAQAGFQDVRRERGAAVYGADFMVARKPATSERR